MKNLFTKLMQKAQTLKKTDSKILRPKATTEFAEKETALLKANQILKEKALDYASNEMGVVDKDLYQEYISKNSKDMAA